MCHRGPAEHHGEVLDVLDGDLVLLVDHAAPDVLHVHLEDNDSGSCLVFRLLED